MDRLTRFAVMLRSSKWNLLYVIVSLTGFVLSLGGSFKERSACFAFCLLDVSVRYRAMHRYCFLDAPSFYDPLMP